VASALVAEYLILKVLPKTKSDSFYTQSKNSGTQALATQQLLKKNLSIQNTLRS